MDKKRYPLFMTQEVMVALVHSHRNRPRTFDGNISAQERAHHPAIWAERVVSSETAAVLAQPRRVTSTFALNP